MLLLLVLSLFGNYLNAFEMSWHERTWLWQLVYIFEWLIRLLIKAHSGHSSSVIETFPESCLSSPSISSYAIFGDVLIRRIPIRVLIDRLEETGSQSHESILTHIFIEIHDVFDLWRSLIKYTVFLFLKSLRLDHAMSAAF